MGKSKSPVKSARKAPVPEEPPAKSAAKAPSKAKKAAKTKKPTRRGK